MKISAIAVPVIDSEELVDLRIGVPLQCECCALAQDAVRCFGIYCTRCLFSSENFKAFQKTAAKYWVKDFTAMKGFIKGVDTSAFSFGDVLYRTPDGNLIKGETNA